MKQKALEDDVNKANSMIEWVRGSDEIQPLAMLINKSIDTNLSSINRLKLSRAHENPWQIKLELKLNTDDAGQLEETLSKLETQRYKKFSPRKSQDEQGLNYSATLIKRKS